MLLPVGQSTTESTQAFRTIEILKRENGYGNFESIAFMSGEDLESFLKKVALQPGWNHKGEFVDALISAHVDFGKEALVLAVVVSRAQVSQVEFQATRGGFKAQRLAPIIFQIK
jgi:hypothetical protein